MAEIKRKRGLGSASEETRRRVGSMGGKASPNNFKLNIEKAREAGRKGGLARRGK
jgi:general stress protein YciG